MVTYSDPWWSPKATFPKHRKFAENFSPRRSGSWISARSTRPRRPHWAPVAALTAPSAQRGSESTSRTSSHFHGAVEAERLRSGEWDVGWSWGDFGQRFGSFGWKNYEEARDFELTLLLQAPILEILCATMEVCKKTTDMGTLNWRMAARAVFNLESYPLGNYLQLVPGLKLDTPIIEPEIWARFWCEFLLPSQIPAPFSNLSSCKWRSRDRAGKRHLLIAALYPLHIAFH